MQADDFLISEIITQPFAHKNEVATLHHALRENTKKSFIALILEIQRALNLDYTQPLNLIKSLDPERRLHPLFYFDYFLLLEAMHQQDVEKVKAILQDISQAKDRYYSDALVIDNATQNPITEYFKEHATKNIQGNETFEPLTPEEYQITQKQIKKVFDLIKQANPALYDEIKNIVSVIHISKGKFSTTASSSLRYFGMITLRYLKMNSEAQQFFYFFDSIVHEAAHIYLNLLMTFDPFVINSKEEYYSPARNTSRPMKGIFHAHFVFYRLINAFHAAKKWLPAEKEKDSVSYEGISIAKLPYYYDTRLNAYIQKFQQGKEIISQHAKLTKIGKEFFQNLSIEK